MSPKENSRLKFTGFVATYDSSRVIYEKENYFSKKLNKQCATNWQEIDKSKLTELNLLWNGEVKASITLDEFDHIKPEDWYFSHSGYFDMGSNKIVVVSRNIGYRKDGVLNIFSVAEDTGILKIQMRADKR